MPAMHNDVLNSMSKKLEHYKEQMLKLVPFDLTHEECINLMAPPKDIEILTRAASVADVSNRSGYTELNVPGLYDGARGPNVALNMRTHAEKDPPLRPRHPQWQPGQPGGIKVKEWVAKRLEIGRKFGAAEYVLKSLNHVCTGEQLRYMWPSVMHLYNAGANDRTDKWFKKYAAFKPQRSTPAVTPELKGFIQDASALLACCALLGDDLPEIDWGPVEITMFYLPSITTAKGTTIYRR